MEEVDAAFNFLDDVTDSPPLPRKFIPLASIGSRPLNFMDFASKNFALPDERTYVCEDIHAPLLRMEYSEGDKMLVNNIPSLLLEGIERLERDSSVSGRHGPAHGHAHVKYEGRAVYCERRPCPRVASG